MINTCCHVKFFTAGLGWRWTPQTKGQSSHSTIRKAESITIHFHEKHLLLESKMVSEHLSESSSPFAVYLVTGVTCIVQTSLW